MISVAMAAYNGEKYIRQQVESILPQLGDGDELLISYNDSSDGTLEIIQAMQRQDERIKLHHCPEKGVMKNFENAIRNCRGDFIFLSDQDDVWLSNKVETVMQAFDSPQIGGVVHTGRLTDGDLKPLEGQGEGPKTHFISAFEILLKNPVQGSCLAFRREYAGKFLPFPPSIPMHDSWIGMIIAHDAKLLMLSKPLMLYRQHDHNVTSRTHQSLPVMLKNRIDLFMSFEKRIRERKKGENRP